MKRNLLTYIESVGGDKNKYFPEPRKKIKGLRIEVSDSMIEECEPRIPSTSRGGHCCFSLPSPLNLTSTKSSTSSSPQYGEFKQYSADFGKLFNENATPYDNFFKEEEFYNITMKKCHRKVMEDRASFETQSGNSFFGIYDGHTSSYVSDFLQKNLHTMILNHQDLPYHPEKAIKETFLKIDQDVCRTQKQLGFKGGSTALCALMNPTGVHLANVGDSKAVVFRGDKTLALNVEHRATNEEEKNNVEKRGGTFIEKKGGNCSRLLVQGALELTRSIGDNRYKQFISGEPDILNYQFSSEDDYILLASDGFWNEISEQEASKLIKEYGKFKGLSNFLTEQVLKKKNYTIDNITLIAIDLKKYMETNGKIIHE